MTFDWKVKKGSLQMFNGDFIINGPTTLEGLRDAEKWDITWLTMMQDDLMSAFMAIQNEIIRRALEVEA